MVVIVVRPYEGFPEGTAATSRVTAYARGLIASGEDTRVILLGPSEADPTNAVNTAVSGVHEGIPFVYTSVSTLKSPSFVTRRWRAIRSPLRARKLILRWAAEDGVDAVLLYSHSPLSARFFSMVSRRVGAVFAADLCEMVFTDLPSGSARDARQDRHGRRFFRHFDLVIAISRHLAEFAEKYTRPDAEVMTLPIMVDSDEFLPSHAPSASPKLVGYAGMLNDRKDGVGTLLRAFAAIAGDFDDVALQLIGDSYDPVNASNIPAYRRLAEELGISDRVIFLGQVRRSEIPDRLSQCSVLALARPMSQQADAGFPTKLGEYLATGRPVVVTETSDIGAYLTSDSAFLVAPDDVGAFSAGLRMALSDLERAQRIGQAGRRVAQRCFDYRVVGRDLAAGLKRIETTRRRPR